MSDKRHRVILAGSDEEALTRNAYPALAAAGFQVVAVADTPEKLRDVVAVAQADLVVVEADVAITPDEALELLGSLGNVRLAVILPAAWESRRERFTGLPNLVAGFPAPANWPALAARLAERLPAQDAGQAQAVKMPPAAPLPPAAEPPVTPPPAMATTAPDRVGTRPSAPHPTQPVRLGFWGTRGGTGTSTAALACARALAAADYRVALFDGTLRGDLHVMAGIEPTAQQPVVRDNVTFFLAAPTEEAVRGFDAVIVDGGRTRGRFNAEWIVVSKPLSEDRLRRLAGLPPLPREKGKTGEKEPATTTPKRSSRPTAAPSRPRRRGLFSVEITD